MFEIGREFATRYLDTKMFCKKEGVANSMLSNWQTDRLQGVMVYVPKEFHETVFMLEKGEYNRVTNKLEHSAPGDTKTEAWLTTAVDKPINKEAAKVVMTEIKESVKLYKDSLDKPRAKAPPAGMPKGGASSNQPMPRRRDYGDDRQVGTGKGRHTFTDEEYTLSEMPEEVRDHKANTAQAGTTFVGNVTLEKAAVFWGKEIRFLKADVRVAYEAWLKDCERLHMYLATRTCLFQGFVGFYDPDGPEMHAIVKGLARHRPDVIVLLTSNNFRGRTLRGGAFVRYRSETDARHAITYFHGRRFMHNYISVTLSQRETQSQVGDDKGKVGGKAVSNDNILLQRNDIMATEANDPGLDCWGNIIRERAFVPEFHGEGRRSHQTH